MFNLSTKKIILIVLVLAIVALIYQSRSLSRQYKKQASEGVARTNSIKNSIITENDIEHLPEPVQNYLRYVGVLGTEKVKNFRITIDGSMKTDREKDWAKIDVEQYSFMDEITRLFFLKMSMSGVPVTGLHSYVNESAVMDIRLAGLIPVVNGTGKEMDQGETVTVFNDMCLLAPATLIDENIKWDPIDTLSARATFTNGDITISATLYFNEDGQLVNFVSDDRYYSPTGKTYEKIRWSTPVSDYKNVNGFNLPTYGEAYWSFPEGDFTYAKFNIKNIEYNVTDLN